MQQQTRSRVLMGVLSGGVLIAAALTASPAQADSVGPYYATPSWDQTLPAATRFLVLSNFANAAVLDRETGLVWEKQPVILDYSWEDARMHCTDTNLGNRKGWRLPSVHELASLIDPSVASPGPTLPVGHPFTGLQFPDLRSAFYWSASANAGSPAFAWEVNFGNGKVNDSFKSIILHAWCVRGGMNADQY